MVKQHPHLRNRKRALRRVFEHCARLIQCDTGEPLDKLLHGSAVFEILEQGRDWDASSLEDPSTTYPGRITLGSRAGGPIDHAQMVAPRALFDAGGRHTNRCSGWVRAVKTFLLARGFDSNVVAIASIYGGAKPLERST